jgi:hypothetical protein
MALVAGEGGRRVCTVQRAWAKLREGAQQEEARKGMHAEVSLFDRMQALAPTLQVAVTGSHPKVISYAESFVHGAGAGGTEHCHRVCIVRVGQGATRRGVQDF